MKAGLWDDDPRNWKRAFGEAPPSGWQIIRSRCWRNAHWTYEGGYYFHVKLASESDRRFMQPDYIRLKPEESYVSGACAPRPRWFAPGDPASYEIWGGISGTGNYRVFIDKNRRDVFFTDCQY
jgi:hypothetical protein